jgi:hypothetical protein
MKEKNEAEETRDLYFKNISELQEEIREMEARHSKNN